MEDNEEKLSEVFEEFVRKTQLEKLQKTITSGRASHVVDFRDLEQWNSKLSDAVLENIEQSVELFEDAITKLDLETKDEIHVRFTNLPQSSGVRIKDLRSRHLKKLVVVEGLIRQASEVRPEAVEVEFECMDCGNKIAVLQTGFSLRKPSKCICGKKYFKEIGKLLVDAESINIEECPEQLQAGEQPSRVDVTLYDDLVEPEMRNKLIPGNRVRVIGCLQEMSIPLKKDVKSTKFEFQIRANNIENLTHEPKILPYTIDKPDWSPYATDELKTEFNDMPICVIAPLITLTEAVAMLRHSKIIERDDVIRARDLLEYHSRKVGISDKKEGAQ